MVTASPGASAAPWGAGAMASSVSSLRMSCAVKGSPLRLLLAAGICGGADSVASSVTAAGAPMLSACGAAAGLLPTTPTTSCGVLLAPRIGPNGKAASCCHLPSASLAAANGERSLPTLSMRPAIPVAVPLSMFCMACSAASASAAGPLRGSTAELAAGPPAESCPLCCVPGAAAALYCCMAAVRLCTALPVVLLRVSTAAVSSASMSTRVPLKVLSACCRAASSVTAFAAVLLSDWIPTLICLSSSSSAMLSALLAISPGGSPASVAGAWLICIACRSSENAVKHRCA